jgi:putative membrane protein insertion efficiency factor
MERGESQRVERAPIGRWRAAIAVVVLFLAHDFLVPTRYAIDARLAMFAIDRYREVVSPHLHGIVQCRFTPTCSLYGRESIRKHGFAYGSVKAFVRIARCGPWTKMGTIDQP